MLPGISSDILPGISSGILSGVLPGISWYSVWHSFWQSFWHIFWPSFWHIFLHSFWHLFWHSFWNPLRHSFLHIFWPSFWHSFWQSFWHIFWPSFWYSFWHISWHSFLQYMQSPIWQSFWHIFWHSFRHIFWHSVWYSFGSGGEHLAAGPVANTRRESSRFPGSGGEHLAPTIAIELGVSPILIAIVSSFPSPLCTERTCMLLGRRGGGGGAGGGGGMCLTSLVSFFQGRIKACRKIFECLRMQRGLKPHYGDPLAVLRPNDQHKTSSHCSKFSNFIEVSNSQRCEKMFQRPHHQSVLLHVLYLWWHQETPGLSAARASPFPHSGKLKGSWANQLAVSSPKLLGRTFHQIRVSWNLTLMPWPMNDPRMRSLPFYLKTTGL